MFRELLIVPVAGPAEAGRIERRTALSHTTVAFVPDAAAALDVVDQAASAPIDLIELYGELDATTAAGIRAVVPATAVGLIGAQPRTESGPRAVLIESPEADPLIDRHDVGDGAQRVTVVFVPDAASAPRVAQELVASGATNVELCGGMGADVAAQVIAALDGSARVSAVLFGFESLPAAADYRARFEKAFEAG